jgi:hypothetical protein
LAQNQGNQPRDVKRNAEGVTDPQGKEAARRDAKWSPLGQRERDMLYQNYARELPIEYRDLLKDYYEALSK